MGIKRQKPKHAIKINYSYNYWVILTECIGWFLLGAVAGFAVFYFFTDFSITFINKYKFLQGIFGIKQYEEGMRYVAVLLVILVGNIVSTVAYFALGYFKTLIPLSIITGFFMVILLFAGSAIRQVIMPLEVIILFSVESLYRCMALSAGEHLYKNKLEKKSVLVSSIMVIFLFLLGAAFYEIYQIFGYIF